MGSNYGTAQEIGYASNKDVKFSRICGIHIDNFRTLKDRNIKLGKNLTIISGKNGTTKSCILGLIAHPFSSPNKAVDSFGNKLKTDMRDVFFLSLEKDNIQYNYDLIAETEDGKKLSESVRVYPRPDESRHRVTVGKDNKVGAGNFYLNTSYINLKRLNPIVDTDAQRESAENDVELQKFVASGYSQILQKESFLHPLKVDDSKVNKTTFSPSKEANYDYKSISSGEDNIGHILGVMYAFIKNRTNDGNLQGILCIDEIEASLHPVAQVNFLNFLLEWSKNYNVQVVVTTHSLYLIQYAMRKQEVLLDKDSLLINMISTAYVADNNYRVLVNPTYNIAYKELTFENPMDVENLYKISILCEDDVAVRYLKDIIKTREIIRNLEFIHDMNSDSEGTSYKTYKQLIRNGEKLLGDSVIVFDPDVDIKDLKGKKSAFIKLPSYYELPIEKEIVKYIHDLPGDDPFFRYYNKEQASFINDFSQYGIESYLVEDMKNSKTNKFKNWANSDKNFKRYMNYYAKYNTIIIAPFRKALIDMINEKYAIWSLPLITM